MSLRTLPWSVAEALKSPEEVDEFGREMAAEGALMAFAEQQQRKYRALRRAWLESLNWPWPAEPDQQPESPTHGE